MTGIDVKLNLIRDVITEEYFLNSVINKLLCVIREQYRNRLKRYDADLKKFEKQYNISSDILYEKFENGEMGDDMDMFEWVGLVDLRLDLSQKLARIDAAV